METVLSQEIATSARLQDLEELYAFHDAVAVQGFLRLHSPLIDVLIEAYPYLEKCFGPDPKVVLRVITDPEMEGSRRLFGYILTSLPADRALACLDELDDEWFLDQSDRVGDLLNFNL